MTGLYVIIEPKSGRDVCVLASDGKYFFFEAAGLSSRYFFSDAFEAGELPEDIRTGMALVDLSPTGSVEGVGHKSKLDVSSISPLNKGLSLSVKQYVGCEELELYINKTDAPETLIEKLVLFDALPALVKMSGSGWK